MIIRQVDFKKDYDEIASWWKAQDWPVLPANMLSPSGFIAENAQHKIAATWIFKMNCPIFLMEWTVGNPEVHHTIREEALRQVTNKACEWAKENGAAQVFTMTKHERFIGKLKDFGFQETDSGMTHLIRSL